MYMVTSQPIDTLSPEMALLGLLYEAPGHGYDPGQRYFLEWLDECQVTFQSNQLPSL